MIERDGITWGTPAEVGAAVGATAHNVRDWVRDQLIQPDEVHRYGPNGRYMYVRLDAAQRAERNTRGRGRPRTLDNRC
ncbi:hypothetical protein GCM10018962_77260 [Dactylosporangium matsuzakiense]|uniref:hypothetical protein n=1 Tax=Dactylosporangium matsuzakiense TaxID=53360 RepID=UPI0031EC1A2D